MMLPDPMLVSEVHKPLGKDGWAFEIKYDGYRIVAGVVDGRVHLRSRGDADYTRAFPEVVAGLATLTGGPHILDGEVVVLDDQGRADFNALQGRARRRSHKAGDQPVTFMAFDALMIDGRPLTDAPYEVRKHELQVLLGDDVPAVSYVESFPAEVSRSMFTQAKTLKIEGLVAKELGSIYEPGVRAASWQKVKVPGAIPPERFKR